LDGRVKPGHDDREAMGHPLRDLVSRACARWGHIALRLIAAIGLLLLLR
jgi:hypothetical protein